MPSYLYFCENCNKEFEEFHSINTKLEECPMCKEQGIKSDPPTRLIAPGTSFHLMGSGWAKDNYK